MQIRTNKSSSTNMPPGMKIFFFYIFPLIFIIVGGALTVFGIRNALRAKSSTEWPTIQGKIISSSVRTHRSNNSTTYHAEILYEFTLNGVAYSGNRVAYGDYGSSNSAHARNIANRYSQDKVVTVYYMPDNPEECLLEPGLKAQTLFLPGIGLLFFIAGFFMQIFIPLTFRKQNIQEKQFE